MKQVKAIIGGTGVYGIDGDSENKTVSTPYGDVDLTILHTSDKEKKHSVDIVFLSRHGTGHSVPPHLINYRANMYALHMLGVDEILAICAVGSLRDKFAPGSIVEVKDFIDFTKNRHLTYFTGQDSHVAKEVVHLDVSVPYSLKIRKAIEELDYKGLIIGKGVYVCTEGPRFETKAEVDMFRMLGGDLLGMTNIPESTLALELGMDYAAYGVVTNYGTGMAGAVHDFDSLKIVMNDAKNYLMELFFEYFQGRQNGNI